MKLDDRKVVELPLDDILPNRFQPRITFNEDAINELAESIKEHGVIQPIVVRKINDKYEIIAGERRYKASTMAGKSTIPAIVTDLNDKESAEIALIENVQREDLTAIEEAVSYKKILDMGYLTQEELSGKLGKKQSTISNKLRLLNLDEEVQEALLEKKISERHARSLLKLNTKDQRKMLNRIITERLTVRKTDAEIEKILHPDMKVEEKKITESTGSLEVLDLDDDTNEGGKNKMNNEFNNNFNIPTQSIMTDNLQNNTGSFVEEVVPQSNNANIPVSPIIEDVKPVEPIFNNPGFMDVNKIEETATDINVEKPVANMQDLLQPTPKPTEAPIPNVDASIFSFDPQATSSYVGKPSLQPTEQNESDESDESDESNLLKPGKFFNLNSDGEIAEPAAPYQSTETTPESISAMLNSATIKEEPVVEAPKPVEEVKPNTSSMFGINLEPKNPDYVKNVEEKEANVDFGIPTPTIDNNTLNFDSFFQDNTTQTSTVNMPEQPSVPEPASTVNITPAEPNFVANQTQATPSMQSEVPSVPDSVMPTAPVTPSVQPMTQTPNYSVPSTEELDAFLNNLDSSTPLSQPMPESSMPQPSMTVPGNNTIVDVQGKMGQVKAIMAEAKQKVEALGIKIDLDEFDFEDMYQAIFKIDK